MSLGASGAWARRLVGGGECLLGAALAVVLLCQLFVGVLPRTGEYRVARELTGSMRPTIAVGSMIIYRPLAGDALKRREIISFHRPGDVQTITHRIVSIRRSGSTVIARTRGDANNVVDRTPVTFGVHQTVWRVTTAVPEWIGSIVLNLASYGWRLELSLVPLAIALTWLRSQLPEPSPRPRSRVRGWRVRGAG